MEYNLFDKVITTVMMTIIFSVIAAVMYEAYRLFGLSGFIVIAVFTLLFLIWIVLAFRHISENEDSEQNQS